MSQAEIQIFQLPNSLDGFDYTVSITIIKHGFPWIKHRNYAAKFEIHIWTRYPFPLSTMGSYKILTTTATKCRYIIKVRLASKGWISITNNTTHLSKNVTNPPFYELQVDSKECSMIMENSCLLLPCRWNRCMESRNTVNSSIGAIIKVIGIFDGCFYTLKGYLYWFVIASVIRWVLYECRILFNPRH